MNADELQKKVVQDIKETIVKGPDWTWIDAEILAKYAIATVIEACAQRVEVDLTNLLTVKGEVGNWVHYVDADRIRKVAASIRALSPKAE